MRTRRGRLIGRAWKSKLVRCHGGQADTLFKAKVLETRWCHGNETGTAVSGAVAGTPALTSTNGLRSWQPAVKAKRVSSD